MKTLSIAALLMIISLSAFSQDTLITRNGEIIPAKVYEITQTDIKYKKPSNPNGPLYTISKDDVAVIEYKNGSKDVFPYQGQSQTAQQAADNTNSNNNASAAPQVSNNYYGNPNPRPNVNVVLGMGGGYGGFGMPYYGMGMGWGGYGGWGRPYYGGGWGGYRGGWGGYHHGGWGGYHHHRR